MRPGYTLGDDALHHDLFLGPRRDEAGEVAGLVAAAVDVTDRRRTKADRELPVRELDHRSRNLSTAAGAIVSLCARRAGG